MTDMEIFALETNIAAKNMDVINDWLKEADLFFGFNNSE